MKPQQQNHCSRTDSSGIYLMGLKSIYWRQIFAIHSAVVEKKIIARMEASYFKQYSKTCLRRPLKKETKVGFQYRLSLNAGQKYGSILQYFRPSLSYHLSLRYLFCLFLSGRLRQVYTVHHQIETI